jgi:hypothetical protein
MVWELYLNKENCMKKLQLLPRARWRNRTVEGRCFLLVPDSCTCPSWVSCVLCVLWWGPPCSSDAGLPHGNAPLLQCVSAPGQLPCFLLLVTSTCLHIKIHFTYLFIFWLYWELNSGPLEPHPQVFSLSVCFQIGAHMFAWAGFGPDPPTSTCQVAGLQACTTTPVLK